NLHHRKRARIVPGIRKLNHYTIGLKFVCQIRNHLRRFRQKHIGNAKTHSVADLCSVCEHVASRIRGLAIRLPMSRLNFFIRNTSRKGHVSLLFARESPRLEFGAEFAVGCVGLSWLKKLTALLPTIAVSRRDPTTLLARLVRSLCVPN